MFRKHCFPSISFTFKSSLVFKITKWFNLIRCSCSWNQHSCFMFDFHHLYSAFDRFTVKVHNLRGMISNMKFLPTMWKILNKLFARTIMTRNLNISYSSCLYSSYQFVCWEHSTCVSLLKMIWWQNVVWLFVQAAKLLFTQKQCQQIWHICMYTFCMFTIIQLSLI